jgi:hypothetical protein
VLLPTAGLSAQVVEQHGLSDKLVPAFDDANLTVEMLKTSLRSCTFASAATLAHSCAYGVHRSFRMLDTSAFDGLELKRENADASRLKCEETPFIAACLQLHTDQVRKNHWTGSCVINAGTKFKESVRLSFIAACATIEPDIGLACAYNENALILSETERNRQLVCLEGHRLAHAEAPGMTQAAAAQQCASITKTIRPSQPAHQWMAHTTCIEALRDPAYEGLIQAKDMLGVERLFRSFIDPATYPNPPSVRCDADRGGPWACNDKGCPGDEVSCTEIAKLGLCGKTFGNLFREPPEGLGTKKTSEVCCKSCSPASVQNSSVS